VISQSDRNHPVSPELRQTILAVDDEVLIRTAISEYLRDCGYKVIEAASVDEAVLVLQQAEITVHTVLSDVAMPGARDGFALAQWVRQHRPTVHVILAGSPARATKAARELCDSGPMLAKPYDPQIVLDGYEDDVICVILCPPLLSGGSTTGLSATEAKLEPVSVITQLLRTLFFTFHIIDMPASAEWDSMPVAKQREKNRFSIAIGNARPKLRKR
jgi:CheY-like chemotaxis protein